MNSPHPAKSHDENDQETGEEAPHAGRSADVRRAYDLFLRDGLSNLQGDDGRRQQSYGLDDGLSSVLIEPLAQGHPTHVGGDHHQHECGCREQGGHDRMQDRYET
jgi:hypothetical protein